MNNKRHYLKDRLDDTQIEKFKLFDDEKLIFACREHWLPITFRIIRQLVMGVLLAAAFSSIFILIVHSIALALSAFFFVVLIASMLSVRDLIHWSFHMYIATNKQLIEVLYNPLVSNAINSVLLDQIRCTEIDVEMYGIIPELLGIGNVEITFDRPTHKEEFVIRNIRSPRTIANLLSGHIHQINPSIRNNTPQPIWSRELKNNKYRFLGDANYGYSNN